jgi:hypothetical protein
MRSRRIDISSIGQFCIGAHDGAPTLLLGYAQTPEAAIHAGVTEIAAAIRASRRSQPRRGKKTRTIP